MGSNPTPSATSWEDILPARNIHHKLRYALHSFVNTYALDICLFISMVGCATLGTYFFSENSKGVGFLAGVIFGGILGHIIYMILEDIKFHLPWDE